MSIWSIRRITGKNKFVQQFSQSGVEILAITEMKKKGRGQVMVDGGHLLVYSRVRNEKRAAVGVGYIVHIVHISKWEALSERLLVVEINIKNYTKMIIIIA